jgi:EAL domain-containing protein (putative c-di-GMP-specific phosphodiesterase class I)
MELVRGAHYDKNKSYLIGTIIHYCKESNILCLAEGIENLDDLKKLIELGIDLVQGYYIGMPAKEPTKINDEIASQIRLYSKIS